MMTLTRETSTWSEGHVSFMGLKRRRSYSHTRHIAGMVKNMIGLDPSFSGICRRCPQCFLDPDPAARCLSPVPMALVAGEQLNIYRHLES
ncbi:hypothetical protein J6590_036273 [Homalodisca vitripennis]|nr:hypothetical protein J6590_036273 [Homalodisca vitripennis]